MPQQITKWWTEVKGNRADAHRMLSKVFKRAVKVGDRDDDPLTRTDLKKPRRVREMEFDPLTAEQIERLAEAATKNTPGKGFQGRIGDMVRERDRLLILVMGYAGLRAGEAGGLRAQDLVRTPDSRCQFRVRQQVVRDAPKQPHVAPLKTKAARRTITVACSLWEELDAFMKEYGPAPDGRIFHGPNGELRDGALIRNMVTRAGQRIGIKVHPHLLRHSAVSILIHHGANARQVQSFVGHEDVAMTLGVYGHLFDESGEELARIMEKQREQYRNGNGK